MQTVVESHPETAVLVAFRCGVLDADQREVVRAHLASCPACVVRLASGRHRTVTADLVPANDSDAAISNSQVPAPLIDHPRYKILDRLGEGGMGVVYKAEHRVMGRTVALKVLSPGALSSTPAAIDRFRREVRLASRLNHPNIVTAYDADEAGGLNFLVMKYVDGSSLDRMVRDRGPLPVPLACTIAHQAALGLQHAFEKGMVHRDIKPHNLMLTPSGQVKILDFGLAKLAGDGGGIPPSQTSLAITSSQSIVGTPDFLSPEQARGNAGLDIRSDLYSLGCTLYFLLTGKPPFGGIGAYAKMIAHYREPPPELCDESPDAPEELSEIVLKLMAKSPDDRYQTPLELAAALLPFAETIDPVNAEQSGRIRLDDAATHRDEKDNCEETRPSTATEPSMMLPVAEEWVTHAIASPRSQIEECTDANSSAIEGPQPHPKRRWRIAALVGLIALGIGLGGLTSRLSRGSQSTPQADAPSTDWKIQRFPRSTTDR